MMKNLDKINQRAAGFSPRGPKKGWISPRNRSTFGSFALMSVLVTGCTQLQQANPYVDDTQPASTVATASSQGVHDADRGPVHRQREWAGNEVVYQNNDVTHWPLWFQDPFEDKGSEDGKSAWTWEDYLATPWSYGRWFANLLLVPASIAVPQPFTVMASDGELSEQWLGYDHDPAPAGRAAKDASKN